MSKEMTPKEEMRRQEMMSVLEHPLLPTYIGSNAEGYIKMLQGQLETRSYFKQLIQILLIGFLGLLGWPVWYAYRKLYKELIAFLVVFLVFGFLSNLLFSITYSIVLAFIFLYMGKPLYCKKIVSFFKKNGHLPEERLLALTCKAGKTSAISALITFNILLIVIIFLNIVLAWAIFPKAHVMNELLFNKPLP